jgi:DNA-directed RNA polymerase specialized sigma24 family protein
MLVDESQESLVRMVRRMTANTALREDLLQEALIHLWLTELRRPGQTKSWYLQSCKYHLLHYLSSGRSVDSGKRRSGQLQPTLDADHGEVFPDQGDSGNSVLTWVSARDIISLLSPQLLPQENAVLHCFADGLGPREIGRKLNISHTLVIKHRRKIASLFNRLDLPASRAELNGDRATTRSSPVNGTKAAVLQAPVAREPHVNERKERLNGHANGHSNTKAFPSTNGHAHHCRLPAILQPDERIQAYPI